VTLPRNETVDLPEEIAEDVLEAPPGIDRFIPTALVVGADRLAFVDARATAIPVAEELPAGLADPKTLLASLRGLVGNRKVRRSCRLVVVSSSFETRTAPIPPSREKARARYLRDVLHQRSNGASKWIALGGKDAREALTAGFPLPEMRRVLRIVRRAGLHPRTFEPSFAPSLAFLSVHPSLGEDPLLAIDFTLPEEVCLTIWDERRLRVFRRLPCSALGGDAAEFLAPEALRTAAFYRSRAHGRRPSRVLCLGRDDRFEEALASIGQLDHFEEGIESIGPYDIADSPPGSFLPLAAIAANAPVWSDFDLLPASERNPQWGRMAGFAAAACMLTAGAGVVEGMTDLGRRERARAGLLDDARTLLASFEGGKGRFDEIAPERARILALESQVALAARARADLAGAFADAVAALPDGVTLHAAVFEAEEATLPPRLVLHGVATSKVGGPGGSPLERWLASVRQSRSIESATCEARAAATGSEGTGLVETFALRILVARTED